MNPTDLLSAADRYLLQSVMFNNLKTAKHALDLGADINASPEDGLTCIHNASEKGFLQMAQFLVKIPGITLDILSSFGFSPLSNAVYSGHLEICKILLEAKANPDFRIAFEQTALHVAVFHRRPIIAMELIKHGADVNSIDCFHQSPLHLAVFSQPSVTTAKLLMSAGADPNFKGKTKLPILTEATLTARKPMHLKIISFLLKFGANLHAADEIKKETALHKAALSGFVPLIKLLVKAGANINATNAYNQLPIDIAYLHRNESAYKVLKNIGDYYIYMELSQLMPLEEDEAILAVEHYLPKRTIKEKSIHF